MKLQTKFKLSIIASVLLYAVILVLTYIFLAAYFIYIAIFTLLSFIYTLVINLKALKNLKQTIALSDFAEDSDHDQKYA